jgi:hypothetical protein
MVLKMMQEVSGDMGRKERRTLGVSKETPTETRKSKGTISSWYGRNSTLCKMV